MAIGMGLSIQNTAGTGQRFEPKRVFRWELTVAPPPEAGIGNVIKTMALSFGRPQITFEKIELHHLNERYYVRGKGEWADIELVLYDGESSDTNSTKSMYKWMQAIYDPATAIMLPESAVKGLATLLMVNGAGEKTENWLGDGFAPVDINWNSEALDYSSSETAKVATSFSCDKWILVEGV